MNSSAQRICKRSKPANRNKPHENSEGEMAKRRLANGHNNKDTRPMVRAVAQVLATGEPTFFRWEARCRYTLRASMCLQGKSWPLSDATAADIVRRALELLCVKRPPWLWGQREYTQDSVGTRVSFTHCLQCGTRLENNRLKFCATSCGDKYRAAYQTAEFHARARERALESLRQRRDAAEPRQCEACGVWFQSAKPEQRFCSRQCSGGRSVQEKMDGKRHPWNRKTGANGANGAGHSSPIMPMPESDSVTSNARVEITRPSVHASAPPPAPS